MSSNDDDRTYRTPKKWSNLWCYRQRARMHPRYLPQTRGGSRSPVRYPGVIRYRGNRSGAHECAKQEDLGSSPYTMSGHSAPEGPKKCLSMPGI